MALFRITLKQKRGDMPAGTTFTIDTKNISNLDTSKIRQAVKDAGYNFTAQDCSINTSLWIVEKLK